VLVDPLRDISLRGYPKSFRKRRNRGQNPNRNVTKAALPTAARSHVARPSHWGVRPVTELLFPRQQNISIESDGFCMLAKCANPSCPASFRYVQEGRLFRLEADPELTPPVNSYASSQSRVEYFWLCSRCSELMALRLGQDGTVVPVSLPDCAQGNPTDFAIISRHKDRLLRSVTLARGRGERHSEGRSVRNLRS